MFNDDEMPGSEFLSKEELIQIYKDLNKELRHEFFQLFSSSEEYREKYMTNEFISVDLKLYVLNDLIEWRAELEDFESCILIRDYINILTGYKIDDK